MTTNTRNGQGSFKVEIVRVRDQADQVAGAANRITRITEQVAEGAETQLRSLDDALSATNQIAASLKETAGQAELVATSARQFASSTSEISVSVEQVTGN